MPGKIRPQTLSRQQHDELYRHLLAVIERLAKEKKPHLFLSLLTESERVMLARRIEIALRLIAGKRREEIQVELGVGKATVRSVEQWLQREFAKYKDLLPQLYADVKQQLKKGKPVEPYSFRDIRRRYPLHFLLFNILLDDIDWGNETHRKKTEKRHYEALVETP